VTAQLGRAVKLVIRELELFGHLVSSLYLLQQMHLDSRKRPHIDDEDDILSNKKRATVSANGTPQPNGVADDEPSLDNLEVIRDPFLHILCAGSMHILPALQERGNISPDAPLFPRERTESDPYRRARASQKYM
jgi:hypothetical protein